MLVYKFRNRNNKMQDECIVYQLPYITHESEFASHTNNNPLQIILPS